MKLFREPSAVADHIMISFIGDPHTMMGINWRTAVGVKSCTVAYRRHGDDKILTSEGSCRRFDSDNGSSLIWHAHLRGLEPGSVYSYRIVTGGTGEKSEDYSFTTEAADCKKFKFICVSDWQSGSPWECPDYSGFNIFIRRLLHEHPDCRFILSAGDNSDCGQHEQQWKGVFSGLKDIAESVPVMMALGNHDNRGFKDYEKGIGRYYAEPAEYFGIHFCDAYPDNGPEGWQTENYSFDYGDHHFVMLGINAPETVRDWALADCAASDRMWKIGTYHFPICYSGEDCQNYDAYPLMREAFEAFDLVFSGHEHNFARSFPLKNEELFDRPSQGTVHYMLGNSDANPPGSRTCSKVWHSAFFAHEQRLSAACIAEADGDRLTLTSVLSDGRVFDRCVIDKGRDEILPPACAPIFGRTRMMFKGMELGLAAADTPCLPAPAEAGVSSAGGPLICGALAVLIAVIGGGVEKTPGKVKLSVYGHELTLTEGSDTALTDRGEISLPCRVWRGPRGQLYAPFDAVKAFDMRWAYSKRNNFISVEHESEDKPVTQQP